MAIIAFESQNILDSTTVGRELITAANEAAARAAIGVDLSKFGYLDSDNTWLGDNDFTQGITATTGVFTGNVTALKYFGDGSALTNLPGGNPFDQSLNTTDSPSFVGGSFSGNLDSEVGGSIRSYQLGTDGDADTRYIEYSDYGIRQVKTGTAGNGFWYLGSDSTGAGIEFHSNGNQMMLEVNYAQNIKVADGYNAIGVQTFPRVDNTYPLGTDTNRWSNVASVDGDFSGKMKLSGLPTSDPGVAGEVWNDSGTVKISI